jgi:hypothetical protein
LSRYDILTGRTPPPKKPKCKKCNDNGYLETDDTDLPCECLAGDTALFKVTGVEGHITGAEIRKREATVRKWAWKCVAPGLPPDSSPTSYEGVTGLIG